MPNLETLKRSILTECEEDHVGLWSVIRDVEECLPNAEEATLREQVLQLLDQLLLAGEIEAGFPTQKGGFRTLDLTPDKVMDQIRAEWKVGHRPSIGEGLWFTRAREASQAK